MVILINLNILKTFYDKQLWFCVGYNNLIFIFNLEQNQLRTIVLERFRGENAEKKHKIKYQLMDTLKLIGICHIHVPFFNRNYILPSFQ